MQFLLQDSASRYRFDSMTKSYCFFYFLFFFFFPLFSSRSDVALVRPRSPEGNRSSSKTDAMGKLRHSSVKGHSDKFMISWVQSDETSLVPSIPAAGGNTGLTC